MGKRGQVTIFIIIAILIVAAVVLFFSFKDSIIKTSVKNNDRVYLYVENCIKETGEDGILYVMGNGGYLYAPISSTSDGIPYYFYAGKSYLPELSRIEDEISSYMEQALYSCTNNFVNFPELNVTEGKIQSETLINNNEVIFNVKYSVTVTHKGGDVSRFTDFNGIKVTSRIRTMYNSISEIIKGQTREEVCVSCISEIAQKGGFRIEMTNTEEALIFNLVDENSKIKDVPVEWKFADGYG